MRCVCACAGLGGDVWVRGTRRESIRGGSRTPSMAYDGPANPHTPAPDSGPVAIEEAEEQRTSTAELVLVFVLVGMGMGMGMGGRGCGCGCGCGCR